MCQFHEPFHCKICQPRKGSWSKKGARHAEDQSYQTVSYRIGINESHFFCHCRGDWNVAATIFQPACCKRTHPLSCQTSHTSSFTHSLCHCGGTACRKLPGFLPVILQTN